MSLPKIPSAMRMPTSQHTLGRGPSVYTTIMCPECRGPALQLPAHASICGRSDAFDDELSAKCDCGTTVRAFIKRGRAR